MLSNNNDLNFVFSYSIKQVHKNQKSIKSYAQIDLNTH